ncbi:hypothetical protein AAHC03_0730 [Spirometra sp. Aus1]
MVFSIVSPPSPKLCIQYAGRATVHITTAGSTIPRKGSSNIRPGKVTSWNMLCLSFSLICMHSGVCVLMAPSGWLHAVYTSAIASASFLLEEKQKWIKSN